MGVSDKVELFLLFVGELFRRVHGIDGNEFDSLEVGVEFDLLDRCEVLIPDRENLSALWLIVASLDQDDIFINI